MVIYRIVMTRGCKRYATWLSTTTSSWENWQFMWNFDPYRMVYNSTHSAWIFNFFLYTVDTVWMCRFSKIKTVTLPIRRKWIENKIPQVLGLKNDIWPPHKANFVKKMAEKWRILVIFDGFVGGLNLHEYLFFLIENTLLQYILIFKGNSFS